MHTRPKETLEFQMIKSRETFHFNPTNQIEWAWMLGLLKLVVYNCIFIITEKKQ